MKKQLFYMFFRDGENYEARPEYGYKKEFTAEDGEKIIIYIHKRGRFIYTATEESSGMCVMPSMNLSTTIKQATEKIQSILPTIQKILHSDYIQNMKATFQSLPRVQP